LHGASRRLEDRFELGGQSSRVAFDERRRHHEPPLFAGSRSGGSSFSPRPRRNRRVDCGSVTSATRRMT
jgi:hypothetical protein